MLSLFRAVFLLFALKQICHAWLVIHNRCINVLVPTINAFNVMLGRTVGKERVSEACSALSSGSSWENVARLSCVCGPSLLPDYIVMIMRNSSLLNLMWLLSSGLIFLGHLFVVFFFSRFFGEDYLRGTIDWWITTVAFSSVPWWKEKISLGRFACNYSKCFLLI